MSKILLSYQIESPEHQRMFQVDLVEGFDPEHLEFIDASWKPLLNGARDRAILDYFTLPDAQQTPAKWNYKQSVHGAPDAHWEWAKKCAAAPNRKCKVFGLLKGSEVEGAMMIKFGETSRLGASQELLYVDYVSTAPWNRAAIQNPQRFNGLGRVLMGAAVALSIAEGFDGRCALHSLPTAEGFYRRIGMTDLGPDAAKDDLRYFEFDEDSAKKSINGDAK